MFNFFFNLYFIMSNCVVKDKCLLPRKKWRLANTYDLGTLMPENAKPPIFRQAHYHLIICYSKRSSESEQRLEK